jgi:hypothetical protein
MTMRQFSALPEYDVTMSAPPSGRGTVRPTADG